MSKTGVAVLGLGMMGGGMAGRLLSQGFAVTVFNRNPDRARALVDRGAVFAKSPQEAAMRSEIIISMVSDDAASRQVWLGERGALADAKSGALLIESSTLTVGWINELATAAAARGHEFLDAPVRIVGALDTPVPYSPALEERYLPSEAQVERAARLLVAY